MFVIADENTQAGRSANAELFAHATGVLIKIWLPDEKRIEESCLEQVYNLS